MFYLTFIVGMFFAAADKPPVRFAADAEQVASVAVGEIFEVMMIGNPSTGYQWSLVKGSAGVAQVAEMRYESTRSSPAAVGSPVRVVFTFQAKSVSKGTLSFAYARSFEKGVPPIKTAELAFVVREK